MQIILNMSFLSFLVFVGHAHSATSTNVKTCALAAVFEFVEDRGPYLVSELHLETHRAIRKGWRGIKEGHSRLEFDLVGSLTLAANPEFGKNVEGCVDLTIDKNGPNYTCTIERHEQPGRFGNPSEYYDDISIYSAISHDLLVGTESPQCLKFLMRK